MNCVFRSFLFYIYFEDIDNIDFFFIDFIVVL